VDSPGGGANLIFIDPDGERFHIRNVQSGGDSIKTALDEAIAKWSPKEISWFDGEPDYAHEDVKHKLIVYAFVDDEKASAETLKALAHPWVAKEHDRMVFVKTIGRDNDRAKRFKITTLPTLVYVAPAVKAAEGVIDRKFGESGLRHIRNAQRKGFDLIKKATESKK
jgi:hypothetical protein